PSDRREWTRAETDPTSISARSTFLRRRSIAPLRRVTSAVAATAAELEARALATRGLTAGSNRAAGPIALRSCTWRRRREPYRMCAVTPIDTTRRKHDLRCTS